MRMVGAFDRQCCLAPGMVSADEIGDSGVAEAYQVGCRERRTVSAVAHHDQRLVERTDRRVEIPVGGVEVPLDHRARYVDRRLDDAEAGTVGLRTRVDHHWRIVRTEAFVQRGGGDPLDRRACFEQQVVHGETFGSTIDRHAVVAHQIRFERGQLQL